MAPPDPHEAWIARLGQYRTGHYLDKDSPARVATGVMPANGSAEWPPDDRLRRASSNRPLSCGAELARSTGSSAGACHPAGQKPDRVADDDGGVIEGKS